MTVVRWVLTVLLGLGGPGMAWALDYDIEGRLKAGSVFVVDPPPFHKDFDSEAELRLGALGHLLERDDWNLDYELSADFKQADGPSVQSGLRKETDLDFFRAWLRLDRGTMKFRGGRQKVLFGSGFIYRPLGFFDTRDVTGVVPETRGVDGVRGTYFVDATTTVQGWVIPGKRDDHLIAGLRWEGLIEGVETGFVVQYHPETDLEELPQFAQEIVQLGYHFKGEYEIGYWNESRLDIELKNGRDPLRFDTVLGADYTFRVGDGLHVLVEYFLSVRENKSTLLDPEGNRLFHQIGFLLDQPVGLDIRWQVFSLFDFRDGSFQVVPQVEYFLFRQTYLYLTGRWGGRVETGKKNGRLFRKTPVFNGTESNIGLTLVVYF